MPVRKKAPEDLTAKKALALEVIRRLKAEYPDAGCTLDYDHAWQLLVSVRLAAQCTDARVNIVVEELFAKYPSVAALAAAEPEDIEAIVKPCGLGHSKARDISACMRMLRDKYDCRVPDTFDELLALPGVGRKSANLIMGDVLIKNVTPKHLEPITAKLRRAGITVEEFDDAVRVSRTGDILPLKINTMPHPGFPTAKPPFVFIGTAPW